MRIWPLYLMLLPALLYLLIFNYFPMYGAIISFKDYKVSRGIFGSEWVGMQWFVKFVSDYRFGLLLRNTLRISIYGLTAGFFVRLVLALSMNCLRSVPMRKTVQTITYMPHFISTVVMVGIVIRFFNPTYGVIAKLIEQVTGSYRDLMGVASAVPHIYVWSGIWQNAGWSSILFLATLTAVDVQLHEAAIVDGATRMRRIWHIDLPALLPTIVICLIMDAGSILSVGAEKVLLMQNTLNQGTMQIISTYVYGQGIASASPKYSYATAIGLFNSVVSFVLIVTVNGLCKRLSSTSLW